MTSPSPVMAVAGNMVAGSMMADSMVAGWHNEGTYGQPVSSCRCSWLHGGWQHGVMLAYRRNHLASQSPVVAVAGYMVAGSIWLAGKQEEPFGQPVSSYGCGWQHVGWQHGGWHHDGWLAYRRNV